MGAITVTVRARQAGRGVWTAAWIVTLSLAAPAGSAPPDVDALLTRLFASKYAEPYQLTARFEGVLELTLRRARVTAVAAGSYLEWEGPDRRKRRQVRLTRLDLPLLLRPFAGTLRKVIEERIEHQPDSADAFHAHDVFLHDTLPEGRYVLIGIRRDIVSEALRRVGRPEDREDVDSRRRMAQRLFTTPGERERIRQPGPPYALRALIDERGYLYELTLSYDWGDVGTVFSYTDVQGHRVWKTLAADTVTTLGSGRAAGRLAMTFTDHCFGCSP